MSKRGYRVVVEYYGPVNEALIDKTIKEALEKLREQEPLAIFNLKITPFKAGGPS